MAEINRITLLEEQDEIRLRLQALAGAFAEGVDLGPRGPYIRAIGEALDAILADLVQWQATTLALPECKKPAMQNLIGNISELIEHLERVVRFSRTIPS